ncbi:MAG: hypothetical protein KJZ70_16345 [Bryobacterales bacterium]|nr:hypothetical protein [Bryobacterales bacterium]
MTARKTDADYVIETCNRTLDILKVYRGIRLTALKHGKPERVIQTDNGINHVRVGLAPDMRPRRPRGFWDAEWCFYEIGVGKYSKPGRSKVQFFMAGNNANCGSGAHNSAVHAILQKVASKRTDTAYHPIRGPKEYAWLEIHNQNAVPDPVKMAYDLVWIIAATYHDFLRLPDATHK